MVVACRVSPLQKSQLVRNLDCTGDILGRFVEDPVNVWLILFSMYSLLN